MSLSPKNLAARYTGGMRAAILRCLLILVTSTLAVATGARAQRLPTNVTPQHYDLAFTIDLDKTAFSGRETIEVTIGAPTRTIVLNSLELTVSDVTIKAGARTQSATVQADSEAQQITLSVPEPVPAGAAEIRLTFAGALDPSLRGLYLSTVEKKNYAVTQFESTDARRAFPCFDEPAFKATFALTVTAPKDRMIISNGSVRSDRPAGNQHTVVFTTTPKMSTYLVAMAVGEFACVSGSADNIPIRICGTPKNSGYLQVALDYAREILTFYNKYFGTRYPFGKLDVVAVPDFAAGAMENTAAIFYRESALLVDPASASSTQRRTVASILAHEMAHQWFGDLVTMAWWDDLWLNEGFATWMANLPLAATHEDWEVDVNEAEETQGALGVDALHSTRPIHVALTTPGEIEEAFDAIAYQKGAAVLRMVEGYVGPETFRKGVNAYLKTHAYGNATSQDFWKAIAAASGKPVDRIMPTFVNQPGAPLIEVAQTCADQGTSVALTQHRFVVDATAAAADAESWQVPVCVKTPQKGTALCDVVGDRSKTIALRDGSCAPWTFVNANAKGYFRTQYAPEILRAMASDVERTLTAPERLSLVGDEWAMVTARRHTIADYLSLIEGFGRESSAVVLEAVGRSADWTRDYLTDATTRPRFEAFVRRLFSDALDRVGVSPASNEPDATRRLRATLILLLGETGADERVVTRARAGLDEALRGGAALEPTAATAIALVASSHGDRALYDALLAAAGKAGSPEERYRYLDALTNFREPSLVDRALQYSLSPELRSQDTPGFVGALIRNPDARARAWSFLKEHWAELQPKLTIAGGDVGLVASLSAFCDARSRDDIKSFFTEHKLPAAARTLEQTLERIDQCIALRESQAPVLASYLAR